VQASLLKSVTIDANLFVSGENESLINLKKLHLFTLTVYEDSCNGLMLTDTLLRVK